MTDAAIDGMLSSLDPHSSYFTDEDLEDFLNNTKGEFGGIGVEIICDKGDIKVISPIDDLPAYKAGVKAGDYIVKVNDDFVSNLGCNKALKEIRGEPGTKVKLLIVREGETKPHEIELSREIVTHKPIKARLEKDNIAYIRISAFNEHTISELKKTMKNLQNEGKTEIKGIILDLRNNPGGLLEQAVAVSEYFIDSGVIVTTKGRARNSNIAYNSNKFAEKAPNVPMVVLINDGSASASEIVAGALKDHQRAILLGTRSFGKGSVQSFTQLSPRSAVKLTTAKYYTPSDRSIQAEGIEPDIIVEIAEVKYPESKDVGKRFSEASLKNYLKNDTKKEEPKKSKDSNNAVNNVKEGEAKPQNTSGIAIDLYKKDYQFARAYDLIRGLILINAKKVFQWLPKEFGATVPNTEDYPYLQRLVDWAASEPQREIYLVVHGAGFRPEQMLSLKAQLNKVENIQIVDFNKIILDQDIIWPSSRDIKRLKENIIPPRDKEVISISRFGDTSSYIINDGKKLSELLSDIYVKNNSDNTELNYVKDVMPFGAKLDAMRLVMLQNIEKITHTKEAIYLDFDILPDEMGAQIGEVKILRDILMCGGKLNTRDLVGPLENSIIAIKEFSQPILEEMILNARKSMVSQLLANGNTIMSNTKYAQKIIDQQFEVNRALEEAVMKVRNESSAHTKFFANVSHELRTPLNAIIGFSEIMMSEPYQPEHTNYIKDIHDAGKHLLGIINDILDLSKASANKLTVEMIELDLNKLITLTLRLIKPRALQAKVNLIERLPKAHIIIKADPKRLKQVLLNLLSNAVKFTKEAGSITILAKKNEFERLVYLQVIDTGIGIDEKDIPKVLSTFGQIDSTDARKYEGTGLGLPLTRKLVELMNGKFAIESKLGYGTTVTLTFPCESL
ncbi:Carboxy-terminal-processing protease [Pseudolycoriella hygida]|uniref:histidine kinase n=1 Tax=Pseudolycoriella hygida TaxID=35572 RepID=A0A9Q0N8F7_9DIPT|nr:Carboxy-terminal-processing protease [Pseudolycoriella hygida]